MSAPRVIIQLSPLGNRYTVHAPPGHEPDRSYCDALAAFFAPALTARRLPQGLTNRLLRRHGDVRRRQAALERAGLAPSTLRANRKRDERLARMGQVAGR